MSSRKVHIRSLVKHCPVHESKLKYERKLKRKELEKLKHDTRTITIPCHGNHPNTNGEGSCKETLKIPSNQRRNGHLLYERGWYYVDLHDAIHLMGWWCSKCFKGFEKEVLIAEYDHEKYICWICGIMNRISFSVSGESHDHFNYCPNCGKKELLNECLGPTTDICSNCEKTK